MQYNQNNAAPEGGPLTSWVEWKVGQQLCKMLGFEVRDDDSEPYDGGEVGKDDDDEKKCFGWGQITAGGTIANLQSMWCVLVFSPLLTTVAYSWFNIRLFLFQDWYVSQFFALA